MAQQFSGRVIPGQDLCDLNGDKVGTVARVYQTASGQSAPPVIEVKTGFLGRGRWYVPVTAVTETTPGAVFVDRAAVSFEEAWKAKPAYVGAG